MGTAALIVFLSSLAAGALCLCALVYSGLLVYRTLRYAYKDALPWAAFLREWLASMQAALKVMEGRTRGISEGGHELRETVESIRDALEDLIP